MARNLKHARVFYMKMNSNLWLKGIRVLKTLPILVVRTSFSPIKNLANPSCVDLILTNFSKSFQNTTALCTGLSVFHKVIITVHTGTFAKAKPKIINYRCYKNFNNESFRLELKEKLLNCENYEEFESTYMSLLSEHAPIK